jgi:hypothetical protein
MAREHGLVDRTGNGFLTIKAQTLLDFKAEFLHGMICETDADCRRLRLPQKG